MMSEPATPTVDTLRASYQALVEQIPAVFYINQPDAEATTLFVSPQTHEILQLPESAWFDATWSEHVHPEDAGQMSRNYQAMLASASVGVDEYRFIRPDGSVIWIHDRVKIVRDDDGVPVLVQGVMFDVTEQKEAEALLQRQAQQMAKVDAIARRFSDLVLGGTGPGPVLETLAEIVNNPVVFEDAAHQVVALAAHSSPSLPCWNAGSATAMGPTTPTPGSRRTAPGSAFGCVRRSGAGSTSWPSRARSTSSTCSPWTGPAPRSDWH